MRVGFLIALVAVGCSGTLTVRYLSHSDEINERLINQVSADNEELFWLNEYHHNTCPGPSAPQLRK
jgi:hypothetical protein